jgi:hypothetical protein
MSVLSLPPLSVAKFFPAASAVTMRAALATLTTNPQQIPGVCDQRSVASVSLTATMHTIQSRSSAPASTTVRRNDRWLGPVILLCLLAVTACGDSATAPDVLPAAGTWSGTHEILGCQGGVDFRSCSGLPKTGSLKLTLSQSLDTVAGTLTIEVPAPSSDNNPSFATASVPVTGTVSSSHELSLNGSATLGQTAFGNESVRVAEWTSVLGSAGMTGRIVVMTAGFYPGFGLPQTFQMTSELRNVKREGVPR